ncbi:unnamed protein product [Tilletia controversa]|uniref:Autophagy-related protein 3 n=3 Tax=Tilletia TaxID=13289 RepID=A0A8X7SUG8_9BASI|nr:hypothetical protein CF336_g5890 [Tilletia laevis]KAE8191983.1 hypothetical protein CF328_g5521 [Tilletia controversa]KAE8254285.1 hypothetical protein A4X03_0g5743 [Tilletia caries]KAE8195258.1 hypothetical protein CF335_g5137 [Tilletia laevis]KAE8242625.1 hypothetical protein A4X06_0g6822 [Tilletia controversa]
MNTIQTHYWAVRDYLAPVLRESKFKEHGRITPEEFVIAGDFLTYKFPTWSWTAGEASKTRDFLPADRQYLISRGVPCLRRVSQMESAAIGRGAGADKSGDQILDFGDGDGGKDDEGWLATHFDSSNSNTEQREIADIPDSEPPAADNLSASQEDALASRVAGISVADHSAAGASAPDARASSIDDDIGDIPDMDEDDLAGMGGGVEEEEDAATAPQPAAAAATASSSTAPGTGAAGSQAVTTTSPSDNLLSVRTYDCLITYDKFYQTPRMWLVGYDEHGAPLKPAQIFEDVSSDYAQKTVTIEPFPHAASMSTASVHPCRHASVMKKIIERMNGSVVEEQRKAKAAAVPAGSGGGEGTASGEKGAKKKKTWASLGSAVRKVTGGSSSKDSNASGSSTPGSAAAANADGAVGDVSAEDADELEGIRVDHYMIIFLKFMSSVLPAVELDATSGWAVTK